jgi:hypothetical protein
MRAGGFNRVTSSQLLSVSYVTIFLLLISIPTFYAAMANEKKLVIWYGHKFSLETYICATIFIATAWSVFSTYRLMRYELQYDSWPITLALFGIWTTFQLLGFEGLRVGPTGGFATRVALLVFVILAYLALFSDHIELLRFRAIWHGWENRDWDKVLTRLPLWVPVTALAILAALVCDLSMIKSVTVYATDVPKKYNFIPTQNAIRDASQWATIIFLIRDILIVHLLFFNKSIKHPRQIAVIFLILAHVLIPQILIAAKSPSILYSFIWPVGPWSTAFALGEVLFVVYLLSRLFSRLRTT